MNRPVFLGNSEIERTPVSQTQVQLGAPPVKGPDVQLVNRHNPALDLHVRRNRLTILVGEVLVHGEMVMDPTEVSRSLAHAAGRCQLFYQALHGWDPF